jgi:putative transposase
MWEQNHGFPRFKKPGRMRSFSFPQLGQNPLLNGFVKLPVIGAVKMRQSQDIPDGGVVKQARLVKRASGWYVMLTIQWDVSVPSITPQGNAVGIDVGLTSFVATSNGLLIKRPRFFVDAERKLKLLQQRVSQKRLGSNNWKKASEKSCFVI